MLKTLKNIVQGKSNKAVFISTELTVFHRYIHSLIFSLREANFDVFYEAMGESLKDIESDMYASMAYKYASPIDTQFVERDMTLILRDQRKVFSGKLLGNNYFLPAKKRSYHVPILQHPMMYEKGFWNKPIDEVERFRSVIMMGTFNDIYTTAITSTFNVVDRRTLRRYLEETKPHQISYSLAPESNKIIVIDSTSNQIKRFNMRQKLYQNYFFLALPGCVMPHAHNLAEALSVGCIPIIEQSYADLCYPPLEDGVNAIIFSGLGELNSRIDFAFSLNSEQCERLSKNALTYYEENMHPQKIAENVLNPKHKRIFICAEHESVSAYREYLRATDQLVGFG